MRRQLVPGPVVRLTVIKAKTRPGIEAKPALAPFLCLFLLSFFVPPILSSISLNFVLCNKEEKGEAAKEAKNHAHSTVAIPYPLYYYVVY